jgi:beta-lactam-binding protein with PASTA domain
MKFTEFLRTKKFWKHFVLANVAVALFLWACLFFMDYYTLHDSQAKVPDFKGLFIKDLDKFVDGHNLSYEIIDSVYNLDQPKGTVLEQEPAPGSTVKEGRTVYLTVNAMLNQQVKMPNLVNLSLRQASSLLETYGLKVGFLRYVEGLPPVIHQLYKGRDIAPGSMLDKGSSIDLVLGKGNSNGLIPVPDLFGLTLSEARAILLENQLILGMKMMDMTAKDTLTARVYKQFPEPSADGLYDGASINLWLTGSDEVLENEKLKNDTLE